MSLPRTKEFENWKPETYDKSVEELSREIDPELSDDYLLLKILISGKPVRRAEKKKATPTVEKATGPVSQPTNFPTEFDLVDGDVLNVKMSPVGNCAGGTERSTGAGGPDKAKRPKELPRGTLLYAMPGLLLTIEVKMGDHANEGGPVAVIEAMKMRRHVNSPCKGVVKGIFASEGEMVTPEDTLMVVE